MELLGSRALRPGRKPLSSSTGAQQHSLVDIWGQTLYSTWHESRSPFISSLVHAFTHSAILQAHGNCFLVPDVWWGSRADSESRRQSLPTVAPRARGYRSVNNDSCGKTCEKGPRAVQSLGCAVGHGISGRWPGAALWLPLRSLPNFLRPGGLPRPPHSQTPEPALCFFMGIITTGSYTS